ncbi:hypothetical protein DFJ73DRAFT_778158 [Zopfochytrium polystomum]|nr:hypothetical protein DFJ73DRAFT_778158 [Zopfochytrium polystomum]
MKAPPRKGDEEVEAAEDEDGADVDAEEGEEAEEEKPFSKKRAAESAAQSTAKKTKSDAAEPATTIFLVNLPFSADKDSIAAEFADCGEVTSVRLRVDRKTQRKKGFAHAALETLNGADFGGRTIRLDFSSPRDPSSGGFRGDRGLMFIVE